jgi:hypothetical protein
MKARALVAAVLAGLALGACGESEEEQANDDVCDARAGVEDKLDQLGELTITSASIDQVRGIFEGIGDDVQKMVDAQGDLDDERKQQVEAANQQFRSAAGDTLDSIVSGTSSGEDAQAQFESAIRDLGTAYQEAYGPIDCD